MRLGLQQGGGAARLRGNARRGFPRGRGSHAERAGRGAASVSASGARAWSGSGFVRRLEARAADRLRVAAAGDGCARIEAAPFGSIGAARLAELLRSTRRGELRLHRSACWIFPTRLEARRRLGFDLQARGWLASAVSASSGCAASDLRGAAWLAADTALGCADEERLRIRLADAADWLRLSRRAPA